MLVVRDAPSPNFDNRRAPPDMLVLHYTGMQTADLAVARLLAHRMVVMHRGRLVETGLTDQVLDDPQHPYTQLLVSSVLQA
jgi:ABC-type phosphonate transport system ATPase subunit